MQFLLGVSNWRLREPSAKYIEEVQFIRCATDAVGEEQQVPWKVSANAWSSSGRYTSKPLIPSDFLERQLMTSTRVLG